MLEMRGIDKRFDAVVALKGARLKASSGEIRALLGSNGSGKSTMLKLLMRFWDVNQGAVRLSQENIKDINTQHLRTLEGYMTQDTFLFRNSIMDNIKIGKLDATEVEVYAAAEKAAIHDFILSLPQGYQTKVGELGSSLSQGEKQRIGLARIFLCDAPFMLLDEPTSNLDRLNEALILKSVREHSENKTVLLVSHRETVMNISDRLYHVQQGELKRAV